jgi:hypothetical protein
MNRTALFLGLLGVLVAPRAWAVTAQAGSWTKNCQTGTTTASLEGGQYACYTPATGAATDSATPVLATMGCENIDMQLLADFTGGGSACTVTWQPQICPPGAASLSTDAIKNVACATMPGVAALTGNDAKSKIAGFYTRFVGGAAGVNITSCRIVVKCAMPSENAP